MPKGAISLRNFDNYCLRQVFYKYYDNTNTLLVS